MNTIEEKVVKIIDVVGWILVRSRGLIYNMASYQRFF